MAAQVLRLPQRTAEGESQPDAQGGPGFKETAALQALETALASEWEEARTLRQTQELIWLEDLRAYRGQYDPEVLAKMHPKRSHAYIRLTRSKVKGWTSRLFKLLFPAGDKNWSMAATPVPTIDPVKHQFVVQMLAQQKTAQAMAAGAIATGQVAMPTPDEVLAAVAAVAKEASIKMESQIDDHLAELRYPKIARRVMESGHVYGTGILKGPLHEVVSEERWDLLVDPENPGQPRYQVVERLRPRPYVSAASIWGIYPDPYALEVEHAQHIWQRHVMNPVEVAMLGNRSGFRRDVIDAYLQAHQDGDCTPEHWESELRSMSDAEGQVSTWKYRYQVLERCGFLMGYQLQDWGMEVPEDQLATPNLVMLFMLGGKVIRVRRYPLRQRLPFHFYYYEKDDTSIWGQGIPRVMRDPQRLYNASVRASVDNAAASSGPITEMNRDLLEDEEDYAVVPWRTYVRNGKGVEATAPAVRVYQVTSNVERTMQMAREFREMGDEATTSPGYTYGQQTPGLTKTVGGLSMLMGQSNITLEDGAKAWDEGITEPFISAMYDYEMVYTPRPEIKGDFDVRAMGVISLMAKELRAQSIRAFRQTTANPLDAPFTKRRWLLEEEAKSLDLDPKEAVLTEAELDTQLAAQRNMMAQEANRVNTIQQALPGAELPQGGAPEPKNLAGQGIASAEQAAGMA